MIDFYEVILLYYTKEKQNRSRRRRKIGDEDHEEVAASTRSVYLFELMVLKDNNSKKMKKMPICAFHML
jgi:hypothetical protein